MNLIETLEKEEIARLSEGKTFPKMNPGDTGCRIRGQRR